MPVDAPPPVAVIVPSVPASVAGGPVYGPIDTEAHPEAGRAQTDCPQPTADEIVVCAEVDNDQYRLVRIEPPESAPDGLSPDRLGEALNIKIGNLEVGSIDRGDGVRVFGWRLKF